MASSSHAMKPPLHDQITEMLRKIQLLESDRTANYERSQSIIKTNRETILQLRQDNKRLRRRVVEATAHDEHIIKEAFRDRGMVERNACRNMSGKAALSKLDVKVLSKVKRLNALKHTSCTYQSRLEALKKQYQRMKPEGSSGQQSDTRTPKEKEEDAMKLRALENSLEKTRFKCKEAENIMIHYQKLKSHLQEESRTFPGQLDGLEAEILKHREELHNMEVLNKNAQFSKESAKVAFQQQEELLYKERKERERVLVNYRKMVEERKAQAEKIERRRTAMQPDELSSEAQRSTPRLAAEEEKTVSTFEEAFRHIKEATGVTDIQEIVERFVSQRETHQHLEELKTENEEVLQQLKEQKELLTQQFQDMKYSGEAKLSSDHQMLKEREELLQAQQQRCDSLKHHLDRQVKALDTLRAGVEHLADKLRHIEPSMSVQSEDTAAKVSPDSDEFVLELLTQCELKLQSLHRELQGKDVAALRKEMEEEEFFVRIEAKLPAYNTRVKLPDTQRADHFNDEGDSEEDEVDIISREALKRQSQLIIDSKSKKKSWKKKGKL